MMQRNMLRNSNTLLLNVTITGNYGVWGGGIFCGDSSVFENVIITENKALGYGDEMSGPGEGGGIYINGNPVLKDVTIKSNIADIGGGVYCNSSSPKLIDICFSGNLADYYGGGIYCIESAIDLRNVTMAENSAELDGGALYCEYSEVFLTNAVLWDNEPYEIYFEADIYIPVLDSLWVAWSDVEGGKEGIINHNWATIKWKDSNIDTDPLFSGTGEHPFALSTFSPCIDAGTPDTTGLFLPPWDLAGNPRIWNAHIDMGAYEWNNVGVEEVELQVAGCELQVYPNPSGGISDIRYQIPDIGSVLATGNRQVAKECKVLMEVFDLTGRKIRTLVNEIQEPGTYEVQFNGADFPTGVYIIKLHAGEKVQTEKILLIKANS